MMRQTLRTATIIALSFFMISCDGDKTPIDLDDHLQSETYIINPTETDGEILCEFYPVYLVGKSEPTYQLGNPRLSIFQKTRMLKTFSKYKVHVERENGFLFIPCEIMGDVNYIYNLTKKSGLEFQKRE